MLKEGNLYNVYLYFRKYRGKSKPEWQAEQNEGGS